MEYLHSYASTWVTVKAGLWTLDSGLDHGLDHGLDYGLTGLAAELLTTVVCKSLVSKSTVVIQH